MNPKVVRKLHDRGAALCIKWFYTRNAHVKQRPGKIRVEGDAMAAAFKLDYVEATGIWEVIDGLWQYTTALRSIRPEDHSGHVLMLVLHRYRFFAGTGATPSQQQKMIISFIDTVFQVGGHKYGTF